ncbi:methionine ABC transporter ATP-binding protein [Serratia marcescens]|uniref:methionine ABC transporter ATP-binding protein n=1 Tax=Serratia marcescens TaxID=615 RepID=UPI000F7E7C61|nr:methionine ABC transporter ATP-binding protein [Serratia marcescens]RTF06862.1 methionine ABC transporter ATP-binding protein [Serratia marcescens]
MSIEINGINKYFGRTKVLNDISLDIASGEMVALLGPSGSGKTTLLRIIAGLESQSGGKLGFHGTDVSHMHARDRRVGFVFQHYALFRHMTVFDNIAFGLTVLPRRERPNAAAIKQKVTQLLEMVQLGHLANRYPSQLSGGQKQRVAIARALASNPKVLLCDEATSALDPATTRSILELLKDINRRLGLTILLITHEMDVVKRICDQVAVISQGQLIEKDSVSEVFSHPKTPLAQQFIQSTLHLDIPDDYAARLSPERQGDRQPLLRLEFTGQSVDAPLLSEAARRFNVNNNIISAQMDYAGGVKFGVMLAELHGSDEDALATIKFLQENQVKVEVLGYV